MQAPCPEIYLLDTSFINENVQSPLLSPGCYYSPQATQTPGILPTTTLSFPSQGSPLSHKPGGLGQVTDKMNSPATFQQHHSGQPHSDLELKTGRMSTRIPPDHSKQQAESHTLKFEEQAHSTLAYQPQNDDEIIQQKGPVQEVSSTGSDRENQSHSSNYESAIATEHEAKVVSKTPNNTNVGSMDSELLLHQRTKHRVRFENLPMPTGAKTDSSAGQPLSTLSLAAQHSTKGILSPQHPVSSLPPDGLEGLSLVAGTWQPDFSPHKHLPPIPACDGALPSPESATPYEGTMYMLSYGHTS